MQMGAIQFVENMDRTTLTITDDEFENNVEAAVAAIAEKHRLESPTMSPTQSEKPPLSSRQTAPGVPSSSRPSLDADASGTPRRSTSSSEGAGEYDEKAAIPALLRSIQKPLSTIGRMFSEELPSSSTAAGSSSAGQATVPSPAQTPQAVGTPQPAGSPRLHAETRPARHALSAEDAAARQASAEAAEAQRLHRAEHANIVETLAGMFPDLDRDLISDVVYQKEGR
jgi:Rab5 GDP/GTP exchange factor